METNEKRKTGKAKASTSKRKPEAAAPARPEDQHAPEGVGEFVASLARAVEDRAEEATAFVLRLAREPDYRAEVFGEGIEVMRGVEAIACAVASVVSDPGTRWFCQRVQSIAAGAATIAARAK